jgi:hypothetical protein
MSQLKNAVMTHDEETVLLFKGLMADLSPEQRENVDTCIATLREMLTRYPGGEAVLAIGFIGAEMQLAHG